MAQEQSKRDAASLADEIRDHYYRFSESSRLESGRGQLEKARTLDIFDRMLPPVPAIIYDIGGAGGIYSFPLAERGYRVALFDPVARHVDEARERNAECPRRLDATVVADGRAIPRPANSADAVLLMGPLYHLQKLTDRMAALSEARRLLKPGGVLIASAISRYASLIDGGYAGVLNDPAFAAIVRHDLDTGYHDNPTGNPDFFTTSFFHHPGELRAEVTKAGFAEIRLLMVEGPFGMIPGGEERWGDESYRTTVLDFIRSVETEPSLMGASIHFVAVGRKPA